MHHMIVPRYKKNNKKGWKNKYFWSTLVQGKNMKAGHKHEVEFLNLLLEQKQRILEDANATLQIASDLLSDSSGAPKKQKATQK